MKISKIFYVGQYGINFHCVPQDILPLHEVLFISWPYVVNFFLPQNSTFAQSPHDPRLQADLHEILTNIEQLHAQGQFSGCITRFFKIIEMCANKRPVRKHSGDFCVSFWIEMNDFLMNLFHPFLGKFCVPVD